MEHYCFVHVMDNIYFVYAMSLLQMRLPGYNEEEGNIIAILLAGGPGQCRSVRANSCLPCCCLCCLARLSVIRVVWSALVFVSVVWSSLLSSLDVKMQ